MLTQTVYFISFLYIESPKTELEFKQTAKAVKFIEDVLHLSTSYLELWTSRSTDGVKKMKNAA